MSSNQRKNRRDTNVNIPRERKLPAEFHQGRERGILFAVASGDGKLARDLDRSLEESQANKGASAYRWFRANVSPIFLPDFFLASPTRGDDDRVMAFIAGFVTAYYDIRSGALYNIQRKDLGADQYVDDLAEANP